MRIAFIRRVSAIMFGFFFMFLLGGQALAQATRQQMVNVTVPQGTVIPVVLDNTISSATSRVGDTFTVTVRSRRNGDAEFPLGTKIRGVIVGVQQRSRGQQGALDVSFQRVILPSGASISMLGSLISLDSRSVRLTDSGRLVARDTRSDSRLRFIAIGAGAGLIIGSITNNTVVGGLLGALAGYLYSQQLDGNRTDVTVRAGTEFGVRLDRAVVFPASRAFVNARADYLRLPRPNGPPARNISVTINGRNVAFGTVLPFEEQGLVYVPLATMMNNMGIPYTYNQRSRAITVSTDRGDLYYRFGQPYAFLRGEKIMLDAPGVIRNGEMYVTPTYLALATNMRVMWNANARALMLTSDTIPGPVTPPGRDITIIMNGNLVPVGNARPFLVDGNVLVPLRAVLDAAITPFSYDNRLQSVRVETNSGLLFLSAGSTYALLEGAQRPLETPAQVRGGEMYVPLRFVTLATGMRASWNPTQREVTFRR